MKAGNYLFGRNSETIIKYFYSDTAYNIPFFSKSKQRIVRNTLIFDVFLESSSDIDQELLASAKGLKYRFCRFTDTSKYNIDIQKYIDLTKQYSNSQYLIASLANSLTRFNSKSDIAKVYNCFSEEKKQSHFGKKVSKYLENHIFDNNILPTWNTENLESIIQDSTKYNLIIFSASWCAPCHKMLPQIKEIYNDLGDKLQIVYVSTDEPKTKDNWTEWMQKENITWRSLLATDNLNEIKKRYTVQSIPHQILVYPQSMEMEIIDIRKEGDKNRLYELVGSQ